MDPLKELLWKEELAEKMARRRVRAYIQDGELKLIILIPIEGLYDLEDRLRGLSFPDQLRLIAEHFPPQLSRSVPQPSLQVPDNKGKNTR